MQSRRRCLSSSPGPSCYNSRVHKVEATLSDWAAIRKAGKPVSTLGTGQSRGEPRGREPRDRSIQRRTQGRDQGKPRGQENQGDRSIQENPGENPGDRSNQCQLRGQVNPEDRSPANSCSLRGWLLMKRPTMTFIGAGDDNLLCDITRAS